LNDGGAAIAAVTIELVNGSAREARHRDRLLALFDAYDLAKWQFTDRVQIEEGSVCHSHPVLTLNTPLWTDEAHQLASYIHEQIHLFTFLPENAEPDRCAEAEWRRRYPDIPSDPPEGCGSEFSNYLHLTVCYFEHRALIELLGLAEAERVRAAKIERGVYRYVNRTVLRDYVEMSAVMEACGYLL
jgi:hypothetical protein